MLILIFKQKTAYEMRISDWSSDVCSSDLVRKEIRGRQIALFAEVLPSRIHHDRGTAGVYLYRRHVRKVFHDRTMNKSGAPGPLAIVRGFRKHRQISKVGLFSNPGFDLLMKIEYSPCPPAPIKRTTPTPLPGHLTTKKNPQQE